jgi:Cyclophilin type peptidyl-prolyl cis-trans isomerase/CLD
MVSVNQRTRRRNDCGWLRIRALQLTLLAAIAGIASWARIMFLKGFNATAPAEQRSNRPQTVHVILDESTWAKKRNEHVKCEYKALSDLKQDEAYPSRGSRHMVTPPSGGKLSLVCCETTVGNLNILTHHNWAPVGAKRFIDMVTSGYFNTGVPFMRCIAKFLCQFGLNGDPSKSEEFRDRLPDDPNWLPEGPKYRTNKNGVKVRCGYVCCSMYYSRLS